MQYVPVQRFIRALVRFTSAPASLTCSLALAVVEQLKRQLTIVCYEAQRARGVPLDEAGISGCGQCLR